MAKFIELTQVRGVTYEEHGTKYFVEDSITPGPKRMFNVDDISSFTPWSKKSVHTFILLRQKNVFFVVLEDYETIKSLIKESRDG